jgi:dihydrofolate synthase/folylpolyglutamate synthase
MSPQPILPPLSLDEWLELLEARHPKEIELGLDRVGRVAKQLGLLPSNSFKLDSPELDSSISIDGKKIPHSIAKKIIIVAGTNGKGSCVAAIDSILRSAGYQVGTYTSPHFIRYNERICINGVDIDDEPICTAFERIEAAREDVSLSYFEFGTLAAFLIMAEHELDVAVLEVGLGGRLDAVNILDADIAVVTSIALDHEDWLGSDLNIIAAEKAAIGRLGKPLIYGDIEPVPGLVEKAKSIGAELILNGQDFLFPDSYREIIGCEGGGGVGGNLLPENSVACAVESVNLLAPELTQSVIKKGLETVHLKGRYQQLDLDGVHIVLDVAHNPQAAELLAQRLTKLSAKISAVFGVMEDKDIDGIWEPLLPLIHSWYLCNIPGQERAAKARNLSVLMYNKVTSWACDVMGNGFVENKVTIEESPVSALEKAIAASAKGDTVVVFGSFFTIGPVLSWLESLD